MKKIVFELDDVLFDSLRRLFERDKELKLIFGALRIFSDYVYDISFVED